MGSQISRLIRRISAKNQNLISKSLKLGLFEGAALLKSADELLEKILFLKQEKLPDGVEQVYIWRTQDDDKVRISHAKNNGKKFSYDDPPETGNPGDEYGCRCWAEPYMQDKISDQKLLTKIKQSQKKFSYDDPPETGNPGDEYGCRCWAEPYMQDKISDQKLLTKIKQSQKKWSNQELSERYLNGGGDITLSEIGYLEDIINYYANYAVTKDGVVGVYNAIRDQIIDEAKKLPLGEFPYPFEGTYNFEEVLFTLRNSTVKGNFAGYSRMEGDFLVISGTIKYEFIDEYRDPLSLVEFLVDYFGINRGLAENLVGDSGDFAGTPYEIKDTWETKFNATVRIKN